MQVLHFYLKQTQDNYVELRYFESNPNNYQSRRLPLQQIADLIQLAERDYYTPLPEDYVKTGTKLFNWLDGNDRFLQQLLDKQRGKPVVLALSTSGNIAHLPWELLHNGKCFLVETKPGIIPVRWMSSDTVNKLSIKPQPENRALQMLFMAASPLSVKPVLDFEKEEASILTATARQPLTLTVEESGCLEELGYLVGDYGKEDDKQYFDVLHLTGHATIKDDGIPAFITESATGEAVESTADDIATELQFQLPKLIFLSGCRTAQAGNSGAVPSMAESLLNAGATSVLGWGQKVLDTDATAAAAALYQALSSGKLLSESLALTYQALIKNNARDWHLLRLYVADTLPGNLVTSLRTRGRKPAPPRSFNAEFLDAAGKVKVPTRESFVGRRRQLQRCLRSLTLPLLTSPYQGEEIPHLTSPYQGEGIIGRIGVLIHGMGGLGKSSLAARLCDRLTNFQRVVWVGAIDEASLVKGLTEKLDSKELRETLQNPDEELKFRLKRVFNSLQETGDNPFLLVLDDFEANLEPRNDSYILQPVAEKVLSALVWAINATDKFQRIIITCRYDFESSYLQQFYKQPLEGMHGADLRKKLNSLAAFKEASQVDETLQAKAQRLADGNPRLLEWLDKLLLSHRDLPTDNVTTVIATQGSNPKHLNKVDIAAILDKLADDSIELREQVLASELLQQMDDTMREMLQLGLVFELPVPREALESVCDIADLGNYIDKAVALGLLEVSPDKSLRVPRILPLDKTTVIATTGSIREIFEIAARVLYKLWWEDKETSTEEQVLEIHRLALLGRETEIAAEFANFLGNRWKNQSRFREAVKLCQSTLDITKDYRVLHSLARSEAELGNVELAEQHYQQALELCPQEDETEKASIIHNLAGIYAQQGDVSQAINLYQQSLELDERIGDVQGKAASLHQLAGIYAQQGDVSQAINLYQQSLELYERIGNVQGKAASLHQLAGIYAQQGDVSQAINLYQQSLELYERIGNVQGKAASLHQLAGIYAQQGDVSQAINLYQQSLELKERIGNVQGKAASLHQLAGIYAQQGDVSQAINLYQQSLELYERIGNVQGKAASLHQLAGIYAQQGDVSQAINLYQQSLELDERIGDVQGKAASLHQLAGIYAQQGDVSQAINLYQQSLELYERIGDVQGKAASLHQLAGIYAQQGDVSQAINLYQQSLELYERIGDVQGKAASLHQLAGIYAQQGDVSQAINLYQQSLELYERIGNVQGKAASLHQLAGIYAQQGDVSQAINLYQQSLELKERIGNVQGKAASLHQLAGIYAQQGDVSQAINLYQQSLELYERIGNVQGKAMTLANLGQLLADEKQDFTTALEYLQESFEILQRIKSPTAQTVKEIIDRIRAAQIKSASQDSSNGIIAFWRKFINTIRNLGIGY